MTTTKLTPDYLFEVSWEVCNKVGGIHTVISTKAFTLCQELKDNLILIGPDVWREDRENPEFSEDPAMFKTWKDHAFSEGIRVRTGRWNIPGNPVVIMVDFTSFINQKNEILAKFWEDYKLDSLSGQWDYLEPLFFGYAAGMVIESFFRYYLSLRDKVVAQFHEWMTGSGILHLRNSLPNIATCFTTHATVLGRCIAGNGLPLYEKIASFNGDAVALEMNVIAKQSLEKNSAKYADSFTTVSDITAVECKQFLDKEVDVVTPNGFEDTFVPEDDTFDEIQINARKKLSQVASALLDMKIPEDALFMATSGRYEYKNKGLDLYVDALGQLNSAEGLNRTIIAFILVPANNYGPRKALVNKLASCKSEDEFDNRILTHNLHDADLDPILTRMKKWNLDNAADKKVKVIFVPSYLNGNDGIFNMKYYDLLIGMDVTVFASYYEPWGYTPLESLAFHVPTITTTLAGFGKWVNAQLEGNKEAVEVIERGDGNDQDVVQKIVDKIVSCSSKNLEEKAGIKNDAYEISRIALWKNLIEQYHKAYAIALEKVELRRDTFSDLQQTEITPRVHQPATEKPNWKRVLVHSIIPERFSGLKEMANNIWWSWNFKASELFKSIDKKSWREKHYNPLALLEDVTTDRYLELEKDKDFVQRYDEVYREFLQYMLEKDKQSGPVIAYFSMEFGFNDNLKIFSGGLGILAGDYMKQASDSNVNMVGVGLLYRHGYFNQTLSISGEQQAAYLPQKFGQLPLCPARDNNGEWLLVSIAFPGRTLYARIWEVNVGRNTLYLLDTDFDDNHEMDRTVTHQLYGGDHENRFRQEMLLGIGGIRTLNALGLRPDVYHCNEGHAAFIGLERLRVLRTKRNMTFHEALEIIRASTLFTTHTPVPAGHDTFDEDLIRTYMAHYPSRLKITWEDMMGLGKIDQVSKKFSMSYLAANLSQEINGVSWLHGEVTKKMFSPLWNGYFPEESHIGYVTNGVHLQTWTAKAWKMLYEDVFGKDFTQHLNDRAMWTKIYDVPDERIWAVRQRQRKKLVDYVKERVRQNWIRSYENPKNIVEVVSNINENTLTIGFARRFATYKRAHLLLKNLDRLSELLNNEKAPVQLLFAGKAHPNDKAGQDLIKYIVEVSKRPEFLGKIVFLENYDIELARKLVQGVDIWLNTPTRPLEASGTSGMKAVMNGALHFSVLDGWWVEGYKEGAGWALPEERTYDNQSFQDDLDAETIYTMLENEVIPLFYDRNEKGIPEAWIKFVKNSIALVAPEFTTQRMLDDYVERFYNKLYDRSQVIRKGDYQMAIEIANWKKQVARKWESLEVESVAIPDYEKHPVKMSDKYHGELVINLGEMNVEEVGVDLVVASSIATDNVKIFSKYDVELKKIMGKRAFYYLERNPVKPGNFSYAIRIYAKNKLLPHRQDFCLMKWI